MFRTGRVWIGAGVAVVIGLVTWAIVVSVQFDHKCQDHGGRTVTEVTGYTNNTHYTYDAKGNMTGVYVTTDPIYTSYCRDGQGRDVSW